MFLLWLAQQNLLLKSRPHSLSAKTMRSKSKQIVVATFLSGKVDFDYFDASFQEIGSKFSLVKISVFFLFYSLQISIIHSYVLKNLWLSILIKIVK